MLGYCLLPIQNCTSSIVGRPLPWTPSVLDICLKSLLRSRPQHPPRSPPFPRGNPRDSLPLLLSPFSLRVLGLVSEGSSFPVPRPALVVLGNVCTCVEREQPGRAAAWSGDPPELPLFLPPPPQWPRQTSSHHPQISPIWPVNSKKSGDWSFKAERGTSSFKSRLLGISPWELQSDLVSLWRQGLDGAPGIPICLLAPQPAVLE